MTNIALMLHGFKQYESSLRFLENSLRVFEKWGGWHLDIVCVCARVCVLVCVCVCMCVYACVCVCALHPYLFFLQISWEAVFASSFNVSCH